MQKDEKLNTHEASAKLCLKKAKFALPSKVNLILFKIKVSSDISSLEERELGD